MTRNVLHAAFWVSLLSIPAFVVTGSLNASSAQKSEISPASPERALLNRYCVVCHNTQLKTGGLMLDQMDLSNVSEHAVLWEKVVLKLRTGSMPPVRLPRPEKASVERFLSSLEESLDGAVAARPQVGRPVLHRLNRYEYGNAIRDLLALDVDVMALLPPDNSAYGFDNVSDSLDVSPLLLDQYIAAARKISRLAVGAIDIPPGTETYRNFADLTQDDHLEGLPLGTRGGMTVRHTFPLDGEYEIQLRLFRNLVSYIRGLGEEQQIDVMLDGAVVHQFTTGGPDFNKPVEGSVGGQAGTKALTADDPLHFRLPVKAGPHTVSVAFVKKSLVQSEDLRQPPLRSFYEGITSVKGVAHLSSIAIGGPYASSGVSDTPSRQRIFTCRPATSAEEASCAKTIISTLARRAYRGPVSDRDLRTLLTFYDTGRQGRSFEAGIQMALRRILAGPRFVFRFERDPENAPAGTVYPINDIELASRLSFFLWSSIPDDELLSVAEQGRLKDPTVLEQQVQRMLADPRAQSLVTNFAGQWLQLRNLRGAFPNLVAFPDWDHNLRQAMQRETELLVETIIRENRSILDFLDADYTFVNERLARHYQIPNVYGSHFRRVTLNDDRRRGLLGHASILTVTSYAHRTAPTIRGKWLLENILGVPPPPPPADVPALKENQSHLKVLTMRERLAEHRTNPVCAACHATMDPLGFALENFDAIGRWREREASDGVRDRLDVTGSLPDGAEFAGPAGLRAALFGYREAFIRTFTTKLLTYALGRGVEHFDMPAVRQIVRAASADDYRWSSLVLGIVKSAPFQMRTSAEAVPTALTASSASDGP